MIELAIAVSILIVGMVSLVSATTRMHGLTRSTHDRSIAQNAARSIAERVHARSYAHSGDPSTWAANLLADFGPGSGNETFEVRGLTEIPGQLVPGSLLIVTDETATDAALEIELGMPRDLNGDGAATNPNVTADARILPVVLRIRWRSKSGISSYDHAFYVMGY